MQLYVNTLQIRQCHLLFKNHLVEANNEIRIQEPTMEDTKAEASTNKLEVIQMFRVDARRRIYLEGVVVMGGIFKETIERVEHFMR